MRFPWVSRPRHVHHKPLLRVPFVGREALLTALHRHLQVAREGTMQYVALEGPSGRGKSALLQEFALLYGSAPEVFLVQLHAGEYVLEVEFYWHLFDTLRVRSAKILHSLYTETKRLRRGLAVQWDEAEFGHFLASADWVQRRETPPRGAPRRSGAVDPLRQLLLAAYQHPWAVGAATMLEVLSRQAVRGRWHEGGPQHWGTLLEAVQARHLPEGAVFVLCIDQLEQSLWGNTVTLQRWRHHWRVFVEATQARMLPLLVVWSGTADGVLPVAQALPDTALTVYSLEVLPDEDFRRLTQRLRRALPRPAQKDWQRLMTAPPAVYRSPGMLIVAAMWLAAMRETPGIKERVQATLTQAEAFPFINDLVQLIRQRHAERQELCRQLLEICAFLPPGMEFTLEDILPLCDLEALGLDAVAGRTALESLLGDCVRYGFLLYDRYMARYTTGHGMLQRALQCLSSPDVTRRQAMDRRLRLAMAVRHHIQHGEGGILRELARLIEAEAGTEVPAQFAAYLVAPLRRILVMSNPEDRQRMADRLGKFRSPMAVELLMTMLSDQEGQVRSRAVQSLADLEGLETCPALLKACRDSNSDVRWIAAFALGKLEDTMAVDALIDMLTDEDKEVGRIAALGLGAKGDTRAVPHLMAAMRDRYPLLRESAALALGQLADRRALPALQELLQDANRHVRRSAEQALAQLSVSS